MVNGSNACSELNFLVDFLLMIKKITACHEIIAVNQYSFTSKEHRNEEEMLFFFFFLFAKEEDDINK